MDRYVIREPKIGAEYPQGHQPGPFRANVIRNNSGMIPENVYYGGYGMEPPPPPQFYAEGYVEAQRMNPQAFSPVNRHPSQGQMMSGIDPRYLATYSDNSASFIASAQQMQGERYLPPMNFGNDYENRSIVAPDRSKAKVFTPQAPKEIVKTIELNFPTSHTVPSNVAKSILTNKTHNNNQIKETFGQGYQQKQSTVSSPTYTKTSSENLSKDETQVLALTRSEKLKALQRSGPRAFTGPIEKVLKWHKALHEIGVLIIYEIVAKCVSVRPGDGCAKNLVVRDDNGPAMQVVYYEIDFLLPQLKPPCTVRVVGRMMAGTCRLQAFNVRLATGDDVATLPRRAAVAAHHVAKLCKEYGMNNIN